MSTRVHEFSWPDRVVVGVIGAPGERAFYLQVRAGKQLLSLALEKQQSAALAEKVDEVLDQLGSVAGNPFSVPSGTPVELVDNDPLEGVEVQFRIGAISLGWDQSMAQVVMEFSPLQEEEDTAPEDEMLVLRIPVGTARAFAKRTREIVAAGRPMCPRCGEPMDPQGHTCTTDAP
ncbi:DUF3090 domain-containing protein [Glutamicibacter sp. NPDC087344]|uniref:DUF3090 domain-containing protein n=1 Tax=Glutamicibacter sp. NPDC087344 TaxID=3363994 RepID=UPI00381741C4